MLESRIGELMQMNFATWLRITFNGTLKTHGFGRESLQEYFGKTVDSVESIKDKNLRLIALLILSLGQEQFILTSSILHSLPDSDWIYCPYRYRKISNEICVVTRIASLREDICERVNVLACWDSECNRTVQCLIPSCDKYYENSCGLFEDTDNLTLELLCKKHRLYYTQHFFLRDTSSTLTIQKEGSNKNLLYESFKKFVRRQQKRKLECLARTLKQAGLAEISVAEATARKREILFLFDPRTSTWRTLKAFLIRLFLIKPA